MHVWVQESFPFPIFPTETGGGGGATASPAAAGDAAAGAVKASIWMHLLLWMKTKGSLLGRTSQHH